MALFPISLRKTEAMKIPKYSLYLTPSCPYTLPSLVTVNEQFIVI